MKARITAIVWGMAGLLGAQGGGPLDCGPDAATNEITFRLESGVDLATFLANYGITAPAVRAIPSRETYMYPIPAGENPLTFAAALDGDPRTVWAEVNYVGDAPEGSSRTFFFSEVTLPDAFVEQPAWSQTGLLDGLAIQPNAGGVTVAVIDSGADVTHPQLAGRIAPGGHNFIDDSANIADVFTGSDNDNDGDIDELAGHGTHVAAIIAYAAPDALILPLKVLDSEGNTDNFRVGEAIYYAVDQGVDVINISIGSTYSSKVVEDALKEAAQHGIVAVAAAGNTADFIDPMIANLPEFPAMFEECIAVGAVDGADVKTSFSNYDSLECDGAPVKLSLVAPGDGIYGAIPTSTGFQYAAWDGTSFASPMVAATAALLIAQHPDWAANQGRVLQVSAFLRASAANIDGVPGNAPWAGQLGAGRLDVLGALTIPLVLDAARTAPTAPLPAAIGVGDFDADGHADIAVAIESQNRVEIRTGDGVGGFIFLSSHAVGAAPTAMVVADLNGDERPDIVTANNNGNSVSVLLAQAGGGFTGPTHVAVGQDPNFLDAGDVTGDGAPDLVVSNEDANSVTVLANDGAGNFAHLATIPVGQRPYSVQLGHLNADGRLDFVTANRDGNNITIVLATGPGVFAAPVHVPTSPDPRFATIGDFDADGDRDIAVATQDPVGNVRILANNGAASFTTLIDFPFPIELQPERMRVADLDCDGRDDLIITSSHEQAGNIQLPGALSVIVNRSGGEFLGPLEFGVGREPIGVSAADWDRDGDADLITADYSSDQLTLFQNLTCGQQLFGDLNCDGAVSVGDIGGFVLALTDPAGYDATFPNCDITNADLNGDAFVTVGDIGPFVAALTR